MFDLLEVRQTLEGLSVSWDDQAKVYGLLGDFSPLFRRTFDHSFRVGSLCGKAADVLDLGSDKALLVVAGMLHDIGKSCLDADLVEGRNGPLSPEEMEVIQEHVLAGYYIIKGKQFSNPILAQVVLCHHMFQKISYPKKFPPSAIISSQKELVRIMRLARVLEMCDFKDAMDYRRDNKRFGRADTPVHEMVEILYRHNPDVIPELDLLVARGVFVFQGP